MSELRNVYNTGSHSVICHPTQVDAPHFNPSHTDRYSVYLPRRDGRVGGWLYTEVSFVLNTTVLTINRLVAQLRVEQKRFRKCQ